FITSLVMSAVLVIGLNAWKSLFTATMAVPPGSGSPATIGPPASPPEHPPVIRRAAARTTLTERSISIEHLHEDFASAYPGTVEQAAGDAPPNVPTWRRPDIAAGLLPLTIGTRPRPHPDRKGNAAEDPDIRRGLRQQVRCYARRGDIATSRGHEGLADQRRHVHSDERYCPSTRLTIPRSSSSSERVCRGPTRSVHASRIAAAIEPREAPGTISPTSIGRPSSRGRRSAGALDSAVLRPTGTEACRRRATPSTTCALPTSLRPPATISPTAGSA